jgi:hypothetical protein
VKGEPIAAQVSACRSNRVIVSDVAVSSISRSVSGYRDGETIVRPVYRATKGRAMSVEDPTVDPRTIPDNPDAQPNPPRNPAEGNPLPDEGEGGNDVSPGGE